MTGIVSVGVDVGGGAARRQEHPIRKGRKERGGWAGE